MVVAVLFSADSADVEEVTVSTRKLGRLPFVIGDDIAGVAGRMGDELFSVMGSRERENVDVEGFGVGNTTDGRTSCTWTSPSSKTECFRA